jgi:hypothetical protein
LLDDAEVFVATEDLERAATYARQAVQLVITTDEPYLSNYVCWWGSLAGFAEIVLPACEQAVEFADETEKAFVRDSRGLARALTGDIAGAIEDFKAYVEWSQVDEAYEQLVSKREAWISELEAGRDPFNQETLEALRDE